MNMKIVHISPNAPYNDYWGYQENLLPKYQKKLGHNVTLLITCTSHKDGQIISVPPSDYVLDDGVRVVRLPIKKFPTRWLTGIHSHMNVLTYLKQIKPDYIFFHGLVSTTIFEAIRYKKKYNPDCVIVQDNHLDYNIGHKFSTYKLKIQRAFFRMINRRSIKYVDRVYGVTPWRKTYAEDYFRIPPSKTDVLIMGADDEKIDFANRNIIRNRIRELYGISENDFLITTGGKLDARKNVEVLMQAAGELSDVKLLVFGQVDESIRESFDALLNKYKNIIYIGWIDSDKVYDYFFASDLVFFPGQHSVLWEQACAAKIPCVFPNWEGMEHVNNGGNSILLDDVSLNGVTECIKSLRFTDLYDNMNRIAKSENTDIYMYSKIAERSLECCDKKN